jgi:hypothetical protein
MSVEQLNSFTSFEETGHTLGRWLFQDGCSSKKNTINLPTFHARKPLLSSFDRPVLIPADFNGSFKSLLDCRIRIGNSERQLNCVFLKDDADVCCSPRGRGRVAHKAFFQGDNSPQFMPVGRGSL